MAAVQSSLEGRGPLLIFFDGRFLPVESASVQIDHPTKPVKSVGKSNPTFATKAARYTLIFSTLRNPMARQKPSGQRNEAIVYTRESEIVLEDPIIDEYNNTLGEVWKLVIYGSGCRTSPR